MAERPDCNRDSNTDSHADSVALVMPPETGDSWWQPEPANGYAEVRVGRHNLPGDGRLSTGVQEIAPHSFIREHFHPVEEELLFFWEGEGAVVIDGGEEQRVTPGTTVYLGPGRRHKIVNDTDRPLKMMWTLLPGGLETFFGAIGRRRAAGQPAPAPFPRPEDVERIETETVFGRAKS